MDLMGATITLSGVLAFVGTLIAVLNYLSNRDRNAKKDSEEDRKKASADEARLVRMETMLVNIEKNTSNVNSRVNDHDKWLTKHETCLSVIEKELDIKNKGDK